MCPNRNGFGNSVLYRKANASFSHWFFTWSSVLAKLCIKSDFRLKRHNVWVILINYSKIWKVTSMKRIYDFSVINHTTSSWENCYLYIGSIVISSFFLVLIGNSELKIGSMKWNGSISWWKLPFATTTAMFIMMIPSKYGWPEKGLR